ncbi:MAG: SDR family oxidoreductase, partial [Myxococcota bacterium]
MSEPPTRRTGPAPADGATGPQDPSDSDNPFGEQLAGRIADAVELLEAIDKGRGIMAHVAPDMRRRLLIAAGRVSRPSRNAMKAQARAMRRYAVRQTRAADKAALAATGIRATRARAVFPTPAAQLPDPAAATQSTPPASPPSSQSSTPDSSPRVTAARNCYQCKRDYHQLHHFYDSLCPQCAELNWRKRWQSADLSGRTAVVTGARVKIGYQAAIKLLRAGARVVATTRFPRDAAARYSAESDFAEWADRLHICGLDLRHTPSVEIFARSLGDHIEHLDFLLNNACQTVRRPAGFYRHLIAAETRPLDELPQSARSLILSDRRALITPAAGDERALGLSRSAELSQLPLLPHDLEFGHHLFPAGQLDADLQQIDLRGINSWRLTLAEVPTIELLEVHLVNAVAPFVLCARLKPLMLRRPGRDKHIVNVSAMEGQFYRSFKTDKHPHTNMAKAALNMLTRTSAADYIKDGIHMNSVDTGWV